jgi:hypothetical protein
MKTSIILFLFCFLAIAGCQTLNNEKQEQVHLEITPKLPVITDSAPIVEIEVDQEIKLSKSLNIHWRIVNPRNEPIYIYSTLLKHSAIADILLDTEGKAIEIQFTRLNAISVSPYAFPSAEFLKIESKKSFEGQFVGSKSVGQKDYYNSKDTGVKLQQITEGQWQIRIAIAYGSEIDTVQKDLAELVKNGSEEHPINPIVKWQKITYSKPISINFQK